MDNYLRKRMTGGFPQDFLCVFEWFLLCNRASLWVFGGEFYRHLSLNIVSSTNWMNQWTIGFTIFIWSADISCRKLKFSLLFSSSSSSDTNLVGTFSFIEEISHNSKLKFVRTMVLENVSQISDNYFKSDFYLHCFFFCVLIWKVFSFFFSLRQSNFQVIMYFLFKVSREKLNWKKNSKVFREMRLMES